MVVYYVMGINIYKIISKEVKIDYWEQIMVICYDGNKFIYIMFCCLFIYRMGIYRNYLVLFEIFMCK